MKNDEAVGNDNISKEMLQACGKISIKKVCLLTNNVYESGIIPQKMKEFIFITIPKKEIYFSAATTDFTYTKMTLS